MVEEWCIKNACCSDASAFAHIRNLYTGYEAGNYNDHLRYKYYAYNVAMGRYEFINGTVKIHPKQSSTY
jgi:hypothetical protein